MHPEQLKKNTIYINDLETLNDSSFTNNIECMSNKENNKEQQIFGDSISMIPSRIDSKFSFLDDNAKNTDILKVQEDLNNKEKENSLLKKQLNDLQKIMISIKDNESLNQKKFIKLNEICKNFEKNITDLKNENNLKEKHYIEQIEHLKNEIKNKDIIINNLEEKIIIKNQVIKNLNNFLKTKELEIVDFKKILNKNKFSYSNLNTNSNIIKEDENYSVKNKKNINLCKEVQQNMNLKHFLQKYKKFNNTKKNKNKMKKRNTEDKSISNILQKTLIHHTGSYHNKAPIGKINYLYMDDSKLNIQKKKIKDVSLKKQLTLSKPIIYKMDHNKNKNKNKNNESNSMKNIFNFNLDRNSFRHSSYITSFSCISFKDKNNCQDNVNDKNRILEMNNLTNNNLIKNGNPQEVFIKRLYKNSKRLIKTSISDSTNSNVNSDNENNKYNYKEMNYKTDNISYDYNFNNENSITKKNLYINNSKKNINKDYNNNIKNVNQKYRIMRKKK